MRLTSPQKRLLLTLLEYDCVVHILAPVRGANYESAFYGHRGPYKPKPRASTVHSLVNRGLLNKTRGLYGSKPSDTVFNYGREGKYALTQEGRAIAEKLAKEAT